MDASLPIIQKSYEAYKQFTRLNSTLPKRWRYSLGMRAENCFLDILEQLFLAKDAPKEMKSAFLISANSKIQLCKVLMRLILELELCNATVVFQIHALLEEVGRMAGGWMKSVRGN